MSLRTRMVAVAGLAVAVAIVLAAALVYVGVRSELRAEVERNIDGRALGLVQLGPALRPPPRRSRTLPRPGFRLPSDPFGGARGYAQIVSPSGRAERPPGERNALPVSSAARAIARSGRGRNLADLHVDGAHLLVVTRGAGARGAVQVARPLDEVDRQLHRILVLLVLVAAGGIALAAGLGAAVARMALAPIARFTRRTERITADPGFSERMEVTGSDELARLAQSFNTALDALERSLQAQQQLVADASHELRTPIATLRANVQILLDAERLPAHEREELRRDVMDELDHLTELVADVVELARGNRADLLDDVNLDEVVAAVVERTRRRAGGRVTVETTELEPTLVRGDPERIGRAVSNLLDNAAKWSSPGGAIEVRLAEGVLAVRDHGPGFDEADLPHVFERFYRAAAARRQPGSGLGLAIVRQAADAHGGWARAANAEGGGAVLTVSFGAPLSGARPGAEGGGDGLALPAADDGQGDLVAGLLGVDGRDGGVGV